MQLETLSSLKIRALCGKRTSRTSLASLAPCAAGKWLMKRCERMSIRTNQTVPGTPRKPLELDRHADLNDLHRREAVVIPDLAGVPAEEGVEMFLPFEHPRVTARDDHLAVERVGCFVSLER